jgi:hypothetical protein
VKAPANGPFSHFSVRAAVAPFTSDSPRRLNCLSNLTAHGHPNEPVNGERMISYFRGPRSRAQGGNKRKGGCQMFQGHIDQDTATQVAVSAVPDGLFERGLYWASGRSGVVNLVAAHKWLNLAAMKGGADAIRLRREVAELTSDVEIATAQREARTWMTAH